MAARITGRRPAAVHTAADELDTRAKKASCKVQARLLIAGVAMQPGTCWVSLHPWEQASMS
jgi:hypothetical protein